MDFMEMATSFENSICDNKLEEIHKKREEQNKTYTKVKQATAMKTA